MLSVVLYGRNDSHGYNLHKRAAISFNCLAEVLTHLDDEIIFVDCNTPDDMPTFPEAIQDTLTPRAQALLRTLRLRPALFEKHKRGTRLKVHESLARNLAIRRANPNNRWILSTNTDIVFVPRQTDQSLSDIVAHTPDGFYELPRFEIPETLWETLDRMNPRSIMRAFARWGQTLRLNEVVIAGPEIRYDGPGDFQLMVREQIFAIQGFDESMVLGWHVDSNLCKRMHLLNGQTTSLLDEVFEYHCDHTRQATTVHGINRTENDLGRYFENVVTPYLPEQANTWGLPGEIIEEVRLTDDHTQRFSRTLESLISPLTSAYSETEFSQRTYNRGLWFDNGHVLPFVADHLVTFPAEADIAYFGGNPELLRLVCEFRAQLGHTGRVLYAADLLQQAASDAALTVPSRCVAAEQAQIFERAFCFLFDVSLPGQPAADEQPYGALVEKPEELLPYLRQIHAAFLHCARLEKDRVRGQAALPRKFLLIGGSHTWFEVPSQQIIGVTLSPHSVRVRHGYLREDAFTGPLAAPPWHTLVLQDFPVYQCAWLSQHLKRTVTEAELQNAFAKIRRFIDASQTQSGEAFARMVQATQINTVDVALAQLFAFIYGIDQRSDAHYFEELSALLGRVAQQQGHRPIASAPPMPRAQTKSQPEHLSQPKPPQPSLAAPFGFNVIGYVSGNLGLGVLARNALRTLQERGVPISVLDIDPGLERGNFDRSFAALAVRTPEELKYSINLFVLPPADLGGVLKALPALARTPGRLNALLTMWELPVLPPSFRAVLEQMDVLVAESDFIQHTFAAHSNLLPVSARPALYLPEGIVRSRPRFGLPEEAVVFVTSFEPHSDIQRKNPLAVLDAFQKAFGADARAHLVVKFNNPTVGQQLHPFIQQLQQRYGSHPHIHLLAESLSYREALSLYASCDVFVSLHRAEGLGLGLMESMALGKPVIGTAWSGNMTFMTHANSCPVKYRLIPVEGTIPAYSQALLGEGAVWADPDIDDAAAWMRRLADDPTLRARLGARAKEDMRLWQDEARRAGFVDELQAIWEQRAYQHSEPTATTNILQQAKTENAPADLVIPIYGQAALLQKCVASVLKTAPDAHLILVDDCSPGTDILQAFQQWQDHPQITLARTPQNSGFIGACQLGARLGQAPFILFLNSDTEAIEPDWLEKLIPTQDDIAIVGAKLIYPPDVPGPLAGTIQHAGVARNANGVPYHPFLGQPAAAPDANVAREVNAVTGGCLLIRRAVWDELGGWDARFGKGVYEDVDLCWQARQKGYRILYQPAVCFYHYESASKAQDGRHALNEHTQDNLKKLLAKWPHVKSDEDIFFDEKTVRRWERARKQIARAEAAIQQRNFKTALIAMQKALETAPDLADVQIGYAQLVAAQGEHADAAQHFEAALKYAPTAWTVRLKLVDEWQAAGQPAQAAAALKPLLTVFPNAPEIQQRAAQLAAPRAGPAPQFNDSAQQRAAETFQRLLSAEDLATALEQNRDRLDADLIALIHANAQAAQADGDAELVEGLAALAEHIYLMTETAPSQA